MPQERPYELLEHTADIKVRVKGKTLEEAYSNAILAVSALMTKPSKQSGNEKRTIVVEAKKKERLFYELLEEVLFLFEIEGFITEEVASLSYQEEEKTKKIKAELKGRIILKEEIILPIKAITYHEMKIKEEKENITIEFVVDI